MGGDSTDGRREESEKNHRSNSILPKNANVTHATSDDNSGGRGGYMQHIFSYGATMLSLDLL